MDDILVPMVINECDCVAIATDLQVADRFTPEGDADHQKHDSKLYAERLYQVSASKRNKSFF